MSQYHVYPSRDFYALKKIASEYIKHRNCKSMVIMDDPIHFSQLLLGHVGKRESRDLMSCVLADRDATLR